jgi:hypothetical protein
MRLAAGLQPQLDCTITPFNLNNNESFSIQASFSELLEKARSPAAVPALQVALYRRI